MFLNIMINSKILRGFPDNLLNIKVYRAAAPQANLLFHLPAPHPGLAMNYHKTSKYQKKT